MAQQRKKNGDMYFTYQNKYRVGKRKIRTKVNKIEKRKKNGDSKF